MQPQTTSRFTAWMTLFLLAAMFIIAAPVAHAADGDRPCPLEAGEGVICTGPEEAVQPEADYADATDDRPCPYPVGEGVICTGPTIPDTTPTAPSVALDEAPLFIPLISG